MHYIPRFIELSDSYKYGHWFQYPPKTTRIYSYWCSRGGRFNGTVPLGLQMVLMDNFLGEVVTQEDIERMEPFFRAHFGRDGIFSRDNWEYIVKEYGGRLPLHIRAVPEGTYVPVRNVLMTIENTDDRCYWLTNYAETLLSHCWYTSTVATNSNQARGIMRSFLEQTAESTVGLDFMLQDFGARGVTCPQQAMRGAVAHLAMFNGSDTVVGARAAMEYYGADASCSASVVASEHSTVTSWGKARELDMYKNLLKKCPTGIVSSVSDSYNLFEAIRMYGVHLKEAIVKRDGIFVVRPDSGHPPTIVCEVLDKLWENFGGEINSKGFKVLDPHIRVLQGDGIDVDMIWDVLSQMKMRGYSAENIVFGSGGGLLQRFDRDTGRFAIKCSWAHTDQGAVAVFKNPTTDYSKKSHAGRLALQKTQYGYQTVPPENLTLDGGSGKDELIDIFKNGELLRRWTWAEILERTRGNANVPYVA